MSGYKIAILVLGISISSLFLRKIDKGEHFEEFIKYRVAYFGIHFLGTIVIKFY